MLRLSEYDAWGYVCGVRGDLRDAADTGDPQAAGPVSWELQSSGTTRQDVKMDGRDLLRVQRTEHNLAQMPSDSCPTDGLVSCLRCAGGYRQNTLFRQIFQHLLLNSSQYKRGTDIAHTPTNCRHTV